ncbi:MAG: hypothetical protein GEU98_08030 [Pseudonocardiaceae bacterium]|nr:hypothetical protein [Pseudonocardiaceae bacterium]
MTPLVKRAYSALLALALLGGLALFPGASASAQPLSGTDSQLRLDVEELTPRMVPGKQHTLTVRAMVTNTSNRRIDNVDARVQLGQRQNSETELRDALAEAPPADAARSPFEPVTRTLRPGQSARLELRVPLGPEALNITEPGVYPLLINVNGRPEDSGDARLAALNTLLPVLAPPGGDPGGATPATPVPTTMMWPIMDTQPRVISNAVDRPMVLGDDQLADSLGPGGRLHALVDAARTEASEGRIAGAMCFALDPDLLTTVDSMTGGYRVRVPGGTVAGKGSEAAKRWLDALRQLTDGRCVISLPYADADLPALSALNPDRTGMSGLAKFALGGDQVVSDILAPVQPLGGVTWPDGGTLDPRTVRELAQLGINKLVVDPARLREVDPNRETAPMSLDGVRGPTGEGVTALPFDALVSNALTRPSAPAAGTTARASARSLSTQSGLATLAFRAAFTDEDQGTPVLITPPRRWDASDQELRALLRTMSEYADRGLVNPVGLQELMSAPEHGSTTLDYTAEDIAAQVPGAAISKAYGIAGRARDLQDALLVDATAQVTPSRVVHPVYYAVLRSSSTVWRQRGGRAEQAVQIARAELNELSHRVTVTTPDQISLASGDSPLPVSINNSLPVAIAVRVKFSDVPGLKPAPIKLQRIPANGAVSRLFPAQVSRSGQFSADVALTTPSGGQLGPSARFELASSQYGGIMLVVTGTAGAALILLVGLRIYRRMRSDRPNDGQQERPQR